MSMIASVLPVHMIAPSRRRATVGAKDGMLERASSICLSSRCIAYTLSTKMVTKMAKELTFEGSLKTMMGKLNTSRNGIQLHLENIGRLAVRFNNIEGYIKETIDALDSMGQHTFAEATIAWVEKFYGYTVDKDGKQVKWEGAEFVRNNFADARKTENKFWNFAPKKQSSFKGHDEAALIFGVLAKGDKMLKDIAAGKLSEEDAESVKIDLEKRKQIREILSVAA
jgi:hypothetical protein